MTILGGYAHESYQVENYNNSIFKGIEGCNIYDFVHVTGSSKDTLRYKSIDNEGAK